jgi:dTMP kinase
MRKGKFITFEGCEGVGKSTQIRALKAYLEERGIDHIVTREPGGSAIAEKIRDIILSSENEGMDYACEALLYAAARAQHLKDMVIPALERGAIVICDRFVDSTFAYQGIARGLGEEFVDQLNRLSTKGIMPDITIFLDFPPQLSFKRKGGADREDRLESQDMEFHAKVYEGYKILARREPQRFVSIDASGSKNETREKVLAALKSRGILE